jgi:hypothetical protein
MKDTPLQSPPPDGGKPDTPTRVGLQEIIQMECQERNSSILEIYNEAGQLALAYKIYRCWVSEFQAMPDLDANANAVAIQHIKLENEGWVTCLQLFKVTSNFGIGYPF